MISSIKRNIFAPFIHVELLLFPSTCKLCLEPLEDFEYRVICQTCLDSLRIRNTSFCIRCGRFFQDAGDPRLCIHCLEEKPCFKLHRSCGLYAGKLKDLILLFKYKGYKILGKELASFMIVSMEKSDEIWQGVDAVVPVPLHPKRKRHRGFNQALVLSKKIAKRKNFELLTNCLYKIENRPPQTVVESEKRKDNVKGVFEVRRAEKLNGKTILLVDDVYTTGATVKECCETLIGAGAGEVRVLTLAQA